MVIGVPHAASFVVSYLRSQAQSSHLVALPHSQDRAEAIIAAMESMAGDYESLRGVLQQREGKSVSGVPADPNGEMIS